MEVNGENTANVRKFGTKPVKIIAAAVLAIILIVVGLFVNNRVLAPLRQYKAALALMDAGQYEDARAAFELMGGYKDSAEKIEQCRYNAAVELMSAGEYEKALDLLKGLDYEDSKSKRRECKTAIQDAKYNEALKLMADNNYSEAGHLLKGLDYKDSAAKFEECKAAAPYEFTEIGDIITFGKFEQDYNLENGPDPITWRVLDKQDGKLLIISEKVLEKRPFFAIYWKRSSLGALLDTEIVRNFTAEEKEMLVETTVTPDAHPDHPDTEQGVSTQNKLFLLSVEEVNKYFADDEDRQCYPTEYVKHFGIDTDSEGHCDWWLRTAVSSWSSGAIIANIDPNGMVNMSTHNCRMGLRPACWIQLES